ncbi:MAG: hypothetical protein LBR81_09305 [Prevotellaceae bacterium]|nr:hypothetical protein [Prevotellaceae bacterium]
MTQEFIDNQDNLKSFVELHNLQDRNSNICFYANVDIETKCNKINVSAEVRVTFDNNGGYLCLLADELNPYIYPTDFYAQWQKMEHIDEIYLKISGNHPTIGQYTVKIVPTGELVY